MKMISSKDNLMEKVEEKTHLVKILNGYISPRQVLWCRSGRQTHAQSRCGDPLTTLISPEHISMLSRRSLPLDWARFQHYVMRSIRSREQFIYLHDSTKTLRQFITMLIGLRFQQILVHIRHLVDNFTRLLWCVWLIIGEFIDPFPIGSFIIF